METQAAGLLEDSARSAWARTAPVVGVLILFALAIMPTLRWLEFASGMENVCVGTALETARDGHWLIPTLHAEPRLKKPPLAHWMAALGLLSSDQPEWGARWPTLLCGCIWLYMVYRLGRLLAGQAVGWCAFLVCGSTILFLACVRQASYDTPLAMWVCLTNFYLARGLVGRGDSAYLRTFDPPPGDESAVALSTPGATITPEIERAPGTLAYAHAPPPSPHQVLPQSPHRLIDFGIGGLFLGLAFLTKGPVCIIQSLLPVLIFECVQPRFRAAAVSSAGRAMGSYFLAVGVAAAVALPWFALVAATTPDVLGIWLGQVVQRTEAIYEGRTPWYHYLQYFWVIGPWTLWLAVGFIALRINPMFRQNRAVRLAIPWLVVPIFIMCFFTAKRSRYLLPMMTPTAILAALGMVGHVAGWHARRGGDRALWAIHWLTLLGMGTALAILGAWGVGDLRTLNHQPWFPPATAAALGATIGVIVLGGAWLSFRRPLIALPLGAALVMLVLQWFVVRAYSRSPNGMAEDRFLAQVILNLRPGAIVYNANPQRRDPPHALSIYLNQPVAYLPDPSTLEISDRAQLILIPGDALPPAPPPRYDHLRSVLCEEKWWHVYELVR